KLQIYDLNRFTEQPTMSILGAVREPKEDFAIDPSQTVRLQEAILLAGGTKENATGFAYITRSNRSNPELKEYIRVNVKDALEDPASSANITIEPYDILRIPSQQAYTDASTITITGAVRQPGEFIYSETLKLSDVLTLADGLKLEASNSRIDIFRIQFNEDQPTQSVVATVAVDDNLQLVGGEDLVLMPFDYIVVRQVPDFELQQNVRIEGEVRYPGIYTLIGDNEKLSSLIERAGGFTSEAFLAGATLERSQDNVGLVVTQMDEVMKNPRSSFNYLLKVGDVITVPKIKDLVTINLGNTDAEELYPDKFLNQGKINIAYESGKDAKWYIEEYAAGVSDKGSKKRISVEQPNGQIEDTKDFLVFKDYPSVQPGSIINIGVKPPKKKREEEDGKEREPIDWERIVSNSIAQVSALLTLLVLSQRLGN
ncbi:MAG: SLBB domain-containing protein, partial [Saprospiraceae bacterium]